MGVTAIEGNWMLLLPKITRSTNMEKLSDNEINLRLEALMARRKNTKALKFINTQHSKHTMAFELTGRGVL
jgi:hypothetical protein